MPSIISASTASNTALNLSADTSGVLEIRTGSSPTTALTISTAQVATFANDAVISGLTVGKGGGAVSTATAVGYQALNATNSGAGTTGFGYQALTANTSGANNTAVGSVALYQNTTGGANIGVGAASLATNTTGSNNVAVGTSALTSNTTASNNTAVGYQAGYSTTTSGNNTALGAFALYASTSTLNTGVGISAGQLNTTGRITALGAYALYQNTTGDANTAVGGNNNSIAGPLQNNTTGSYNIAVGTGALQGQTTQSFNTAVGYNTGTVTTAQRGTFIGHQAGVSKTTGDGCTYIGSDCGINSTTGVSNTFIGQGSGELITTGTKTTIVGKYNGNQGGLDIRTASNYIVLSDGDGNPRAFVDNNGIFHIGTSGVTGSNNVLAIDGAKASWNVVSRTLNTSGNSYPGYLATFASYSPNDATSSFFQGSDTTGIRFQVRSNGGIANYQANDANLSDAREKTNIQLAGSYLDKICSIPVKTFNYIDQNRENDDGLTLGVIAQDVQAVAPELVMESDWGTEDEPRMRLSIYQTDLQYALMKCIQELKAEVDSLKAQLNNGA